MPDSLLRPGRYIFALSMIFFGFQHFTYAVARQGLVAGPPWVLGGTFWAWVAGGVLIVSGVSIAGSRKVFWPAFLLGTGLSLYSLALYMPGLVQHPRDPARWTRSTELLAMGAAALVFAASAASAASAGTLASSGRSASQPGKSRESGFPSASFAARLGAIGRLIFAISAIVWGIQHFMYARFVATLVPAWLPWRFFLGCFAGAAFIAAGISIVANIQVRLSAAMLGLEFFLLVTMLHIPRVVASPQKANEWTSAVVALTMCGASLMIAQASRKKSEAPAQARATQPITGDVARVER